MSRKTLSAPLALALLMTAPTAAQAADAVAASAAKLAYPDTARGG